MGNTEMRPVYDPTLEDEQRDSSGSGGGTAASEPIHCPKEITKTYETADGTITISSTPPFTQVPAPVLPMYVPPARSTKPGCTLTEGSKPVTPPLSSGNQTDSTNTDTGTSPSRTPPIPSRTPSPTETPISTTPTPTTSPVTPTTTPPTPTTPPQTPPTQTTPTTPASSLTLPTTPLSPIPNPRPLQRPRGVVCPPFSREAILRSGARPPESSLARREASFFSRLDKWDGNASNARFLFKDLPDTLRAYAWRTVTGSATLERKNTGVFDCLVQLGCKPEVESQIQKDISRTLPGNEYFKEGMDGHIGLCNVLRAYATLDPVVGYCQGMSYLAAHLLLFLEEERAFWLLVQMMKVHCLRGFFDDNVPLLRLCLYCLDRLIQIILPKLFGHLKCISLTPLLFASNWFPTLFTYNFPIDVTKRVWDMFFVEGLMWLFKVALAILQIHQDQLLKVGFDQAVELLKTCGSRVEVNTLLKAASTVPLTPEMIASIREEITPETELSYL
ncbi:RabGAP/TBC superfamily protein [Pelomyxa schiedti]|nr:RabGAP/TBC superfamily protein [Pelomyxa schiedti]